MHQSTSVPPRAVDAAVAANRRQRRAAAAIATTVGAAAVISTAFAAPAQAAHRHSVWDRVAYCESSNRWHIHTGNGYYGGLQFSSSTWAAYHGHRYARQASGASRIEQIEVARRVLASQGRDAWPVCGPRAGLTKRSGHATRAPLPRHPGARARKHAHRHAAGTRHHARHHARAHRRATARRHHHAHHHAYRVRPGDTLSTIARRHHVAGGWRALYRANRHRVHNPNVLHVGQLLRLP